jgi:RNA polymerase sigma factor (sigma-70 family)
MPADKPGNRLAGIGQEGVYGLWSLAVAAVDHQTLTDAEVIAASGEDARVFAVVFDRHYDSIASFLRRRLDSALADELAAETFFRAFDGRGRYDTARPDARPWLFGIAANLVSRHRRAEARRLRAFARVVERPSHDAGLDAINARLDAIAVSAALAAGLASLRVSERDVLLLHAWAELTYQQIAEALQIPVGTVRSRLHRARCALRATLEQHGVMGGLQVPASTKEMQ